MVSLRICGPKLSICCTIISAWGIIMLVLLGIFLKTNSVAFAEDLPLEEALTSSRGNAVEFARETTRLYTQASYNCLIAACLYVLTFCASLGQYYLNRRASRTL